MRARIITATALLVSFMPALVRAQWSARQGGNLTAFYVDQNTFRGAERFSGTTWWMGELTRSFGRRALTLDVMLTFDPLIHGDCGYPRLLSEASLCGDAPFEDRSMMHPVFMGLGAQLKQSIGGAAAVSLHGALSGEPAFGPASYFHRASAGNDAMMPLTHHALNPVHTAFGSITGAVAAHGWTAELSAYNGGSHDDNAYDFDLAPLHSYAARLRYALTPDVHAQASMTSLQPALGGGHAHGGVAQRMTAYSASVQAGNPFWHGRADATLGWSLHQAGDNPLHSVLLEGQFERGLHALFGRAELADRLEYEVSFIDHPDGSHDHIVVGRRQRITEFTAGYALHLPARWGLQPRLGARVSTTTIPPIMQSRYGAERGSSVILFTSLRPTAGHGAHH
jgi:hypothetical protein